MICSAFDALERFFEWNMPFFNFVNIHQKRKDEEALLKVRKPQLHIGTLGTGKHLFPINEN